MRITFLGTGTSQGVPVIACECPVCLSDDPFDKRLRCSVLIETQGQVLVIDTGPDFRQQMLRAKVKHLDAVLFTHRHKDHIGGMDDVRAFNFKTRAPMPVYADADTLEGLKAEYSYVFSGPFYPGVPEVSVNLFDNQPFEIKGVKILPIPVLHYKMLVWGFRIQNFAYVTDASSISPESMAQLQNLDVLVLNALRKEKHISHFTLSEAIEIAQTLKPNRTYFTHISHLMGRHADVTQELPPNIFFAYDGLVIESFC